jgi:hypothetical protein
MWEVSFATGGRMESAHGIRDLFPDFEVTNLRDCAAGMDKFLECN